MGNDNKRKGAGILLFHFPHVRDATSRCSSSCFGSMFSFPACTRDATSYLEASIDDNIFISRLYARCNTSPTTAYVYFTFSFPACTRDATFNIWPYLSLCCFHFPLVREMQLHQQWQSQARIHFHFPPVREMQLFWADDGSSSQIFHFPLVREMQH